MATFWNYLGFGPKTAARVMIRGEVYEGGYHFFAERAVRSRSLTGWMRVVKLPMNSYVELELEGKKWKIEDLLLELRVGPAHSRISGVEVEYRNFRNAFRDFRLRNERS